jgi:hypothetical protein
MAHRLRPTTRTSRESSEHAAQQYPTSPPIVHLGRQSCRTRDWPFNVAPSIRGMRPSLVTTFFSSHVAGLLFALSLSEMIQR